MLAIILILGLLFIVAYLRAIYMKLVRIVEVLDQKNGIIGLDCSEPQCKGFCNSYHINKVAVSA